MHVPFSIADVSERQSSSRMASIVSAGIHDLPSGSGHVNVLSENLTRLVMAM
jgi:hypothetical protein